jgi:hypothetical protein
MEQFVKTAFQLAFGDDVCLHVPLFRGKAHQFRPRASSGIRACFALARR